MFRILLVLFVLVTACNQNSKQNAISLTPTSAKKQKDKQQDYRSVLAAVNPFKQKHITSDRFEIMFSRFIVDSIIPYWYGTKWNFYGDTQEPQKGSIACGYFVTTILRDAGLRINRIKLAQLASEEMIKTVCHQNSIKRYSNTPIQTFLADVQHLENGLYIIGLDFHTGFIYHNNKELYFIHASYQTPQMVIKQNAMESSVLASSKYKVLGKVNLQF